jgi:hypothetical protein
VWQNTKESFAQVNKHGNLQNGIGIQVGQIQVIEVKETAEERGNGDEERNVNDRFVGVFCRNSDPTEQSSFRGRTLMDTRWKRSDSETTDMWLNTKGN